jgi:hypothetical protein
MLLHEKENEITTLRLYMTARTNLVTEITSFLGDLDSAYNRLYNFYSVTDYFDPVRLRRRRSFVTSEWGFPPFQFAWGEISSEFVLPEDRLKIGKIQIASPGFWEFLGSLDPLQQIREYLNDRHRRRQDLAYREKSEAERLALENKLIEQQIIEKKNANLRAYLEMMKEAGFSDHDIRRVIFENISEPLLNLAKYQDMGLIENAE